MSETREEIIFEARISEQAERYDEMAAAMSKVAKLGAELSTEERNLLSVAYKNVVGARRASLRIISSIERKEESRNKQEHLSMARDYRKKVEDELSHICGEILILLDDHLIKTASTEESKVFYYKMKGDYFRYLAESTTGDTRKNAADKALDAYKAASETAEALEPTNPIRLGLALNFSVFYYEILESSNSAIELAKKAFDQSIEQLERLPEESYKDSTLIMQLLRDNITLWTSSNEDDDRKDDD